MKQEHFTLPRDARRDVSLAPYSWWKIGGKADYFIEATSSLQLQSLMTDLRVADVPFCIIGQGTNLLFDDAGFRGCVIRIAENFSRLEIKDNTITAEAGCWVPNLALYAARRGFSGLEHTIGIPASLGGLICMNGGSQRKNIGEVVKSVTVLKTEGEIQTYSVKDCHFSYRHSRFQLEDDIVLSATIQLSLQKTYSEQRPELLEILRTRRHKFPRKLPNCGSVFKSSPGLFDAYGPPGKIIEDLGFKGASLGKIQVSSRHANFIVNKGGGTSTDILELVSRIYHKVSKETGLIMKPEFCYLHPTKGMINPVDIICA